MKEKPLVSIITIVYNGESFLEDTILSVLRQTYQNIEYIIVDGGSTDRTKEIIAKYSDKLSNWISESDFGISDAFNKGIKMATGDIIGIINADDWYEPTAIMDVINSYNRSDFDAHDEMFVICGNVKLYNNTVKYNIKKSSIDKLKSEMTIWHPGMFVSKKVYQSIGMYSLEYKILMDYDFVVRAFLEGVKFEFLDRELASMRYGGISNRLIKTSMNESLTIKNKYFGTHLQHKIEYYYYLTYYQSIIFLKGIIYG